MTTVSAKDLSCIGRIFALSMSSLALSATLSMVFFVAALAWSTLPSRFDPRLR